MNDPNSIVPRPSAPMTASATTEQQRAIAETQAAMVMARSNPRDQQAAIARILTACGRPGLAESGLYSYAKGGKEITAASIRLAECIAQSWGNMQYGIKEVERANGGATMLAYAWDLESNTRRTMEFFVPHAIKTKQGMKFLTDPREVYELNANMGSRRLRACILAIIPADVVETAEAACVRTMETQSDTSQEGIAKMVTAFAAYGVTAAQIEARVQRKIAAINSTQLAQLRNIYRTIGDGITTADAEFPSDQPRDSKPPANGMAGLREKVGGAPPPTPSQEEWPQLPEEL